MFDTICCTVATQTPTVTSSKEYIDIIEASLFFLMAERESLFSRKDKPVIHNTDV